MLRMEELLKNAIQCFEELRSPFAHSELLENDVTLDECGALSEMIAGRLKSTLPMEEPYTVVKYLAVLLRTRDNIKEAEKIAASFGMDPVGMSEVELTIAIGLSDDIRQSMLFLLNFVRLDTLRQIVATGKEKEELVE